ncbi:hypothetical protein VNO77_43977 [Canavalia gladiata]|uniref:Uncharacterized protein n=1 Tax=Canavalia gladiata TaxID=3824 RepID=A0AAN9JV36_CANGL
MYATACHVRSELNTFFVLVFGALHFCGKLYSLFRHVSLQLWKAGSSILARATAIVRTYMLTEIPYKGCLYAWYLDSVYQDRSSEMAKNSHIWDFPYNLDSPYILTLNLPTTYLFPYFLTTPELDKSRTNINRVIKIRPGKLTFPRVYARSDQNLARARNERNSRSGSPGFLSPEIRTSNQIPRFLIHPLLDGFRISSSAGPNKPPFFRKLFQPLFGPKTSFYTLQSNSILAILLLQYKAQIVVLVTDLPQYERKSALPNKLNCIGMWSPGVQDETEGAPLPPLHPTDLFSSRSCIRVESIVFGLFSTQSFPCLVTLDAKRFALPHVCRLALFLNRITASYSFYSARRGCDSWWERNWEGKRIVDSKMIAQSGKGALYSVIVSVRPRARLAETSEWLPRLRHREQIPHETDSL